MDAKTLFNDKLPKQIAEDPEKAKELNAIFLFTITGDGGGVWTVNLKDDAGVAEGDSGNSECKIELEHDDLVAFLDDTSIGMQLFFEGKLKVDGDPMLATKLQEVFKL